MNRDNPKYFDRLLAKHLPNVYPELLEGKISEEFQQAIFIDSLLDFAEQIEIELNKAGITYKKIAYYYIIDISDYNFLKLSSAELMKCPVEFHKGSEVGPLLLNDIEKLKEVAQL